MAKSSFNNSPLMLARDREELKAEIEKYITEGGVLSNRTALTVAEKDQLESDFHRWDNKNYETISAAFTVRRHAHEHKYKFLQLIDVDSIMPGYRPRPKSLETLVSELKVSIATQLEKLCGFYDVIDIQQVDPRVATKPVLVGKSDLEKLLHLLNRFHRVAQKFRDRHDNRETIEIDDEYDVQDMLYALIHIEFDDIRKEDSSPSHAGANSRIDFVLKMSDILLEVKMTNDRLRDKKIGEELLIDIGRYKEYTGAKHLVIFIYDRGDRISNKHGLIRDLQRQSTAGFSINVVINPM